MQSDFFVVVVESKSLTSFSSHAFSCIAKTHHECCTVGLNNMLLAGAELGLCIYLISSEFF